LQVVTPDDLRKITHLNHHAFGGLAPVMGAWRPPHQTPIPGLWFIGAQSESGGGMNNVILSSYQVARRITGNENVDHRG
jgi:phytoene dehydrogenase-like protein